MCVTDGGRKMVVDKDVCDRCVRDRWMVCDKDVCERWCVTDGV